MRTVRIYFLLGILCMYHNMHAQGDIYLFRNADTTKRYTLNEANLYLRSFIQNARHLSNSYPDSALNILNDVLGMSKLVPLPSCTVDVLIATGAIYTHQGLYDKAAKSYLQAFNYNLEHKNKLPAGAVVSNACRALNNLANTYQYEGDYQKSTYYYFEAIRISENFLEYSKDYKSIADPLIRIYNNTAGALLKLKEYNKALYYLDKAIVLANKVSLPQRTPSILANKAIAYNRLGQKNKAWECNQRALILAKKYNFAEAQLYAHNGIAEQLIEKNQPQKAIAHLEEALTIKNSVSAYTRVSTLYLLGTAYFAQKQYNQAIVYFKRVLEESETSQIPEYIVLTHTQLAKLYSATGNYQEAFEHSQTTNLLSEKLLDKDKTEAIMALDVKYHTAQKDKELVQKQLLITKQERKLERNKTLIVGITTGSLFLIALLIAVYITYKNKLRLQKKEQELNQLKANIQGEEKERSRIARELHDGIAGMINSVKMNLIVTQDDFRDLPGNNHFRFAMQLLDETANEIRQTAHNLTPDILSQNELQDAISIFCDQMQKSSELNIKFMHYGFFSHLDDTFKLTVYRIVQELINNIIKHANADAAIVQISCYGHIFTITVEDNGIGLNPENIYNGIGLQTMQARVKGMNGKMSIDATDHRGTAIFIELHLPTNIVIPEEYEHKNINS